MEDHLAFFNVYENPSLDDLFRSGQPPPDLPPALGVDYPADGDQYEAGPSGTHDESFAPESPGVPQNNNGPVQVLPPPPATFNCNFCQVLREIVHVQNAYKCYFKLLVHGGPGVISHAILEKKTGNLPGVSQFETLDFRNKSTESVKQFLARYCWQRNREGCVVSSDSLSLFFDALCAGLPHHPRPVNQNMVPQPPQEHGHERANEPGNIMGRIPLSDQRKRTALMKMDEVSTFFHFTLADAANMLQVCSTVLKKICRGGGITRWPYRKVDSAKKKIAALQRNLNSSHAAVRADAQRKIAKIREEVTRACGGLNTIV